jgi:hypothetical protein
MARRAVLLGAGHAHLFTLKRAAAFVRRGFELVLVAPEAFWYSGLATGVLAGIYPPELDQTRVRVLQRQWATPVPRFAGLAALNAWAGENPASPRQRMSCHRTEVKRLPGRILRSGSLGIISRIGRGSSSWLKLPRAVARRATPRGDDSGRAGRAARYSREAPYALLERNE